MVNVGYDKDEGKSQVRRQLKRIMALLMNWVIVNRRELRLVFTVQNIINDA